MMIKKSMISAVTAAVLVTGFTGCSSDTNNVTEGSVSTSTSTTGGNNDVINNPKVTVTGTVMDTNGNPLYNVAVYLAGMSTTTDRGGVYVFNDVPTINTASDMVNDTTNNALQVTISPVSGYLGATVTVTPESQQISSGDGREVGGSNPNTNFIDGYIASAGTAVLPELSGTVHGVLRNDGTQEAIADVEVCLDLTQTSFNGLHNSTATQMGNMSYATTKYCDTTDANGVFDVLNAPVDATLEYNLAHWNGLSQTTVTVEDTVVTNIGTLFVTPIVSRDTTSPEILTVVQNTPAYNAVAGTPVGDRLLLEDDVTKGKEFIVVFSESMLTELGEDADMTENITIYSHTQQKYLSATYEMLTASNMKVTMSEDLLDAEIFDVNLLVTDFKDKAGNHLIGDADSVITYDEYAGTSNQAVRLLLMAYTNLNLGAEPVTDEAQMEKDVLGAAVDPALDPLRAYSNAFNDVNLPKGKIQQLNAAEAKDNLSALAKAQGFGNNKVGKVVDARIEFTTSGASAYEITMADGSIVTIADDTGANQNISSPTDNGTAKVTVEAVNETDKVELVLETVKIGDTVIITALDDYGYTGTPITIPLVDNVAPTTGLQRGYLCENRTNTGVSADPFGNGGELSNKFDTSVPVGTPILSVTPGLLDNLDANGVNILAENEPTVFGNNSLDHELFAHNGKADPSDSAPVIAPNRNIYDATAWNVFVGDLQRNIGIFLVENLDESLAGVTPTYNGANIDMNSFTAKNNVALDDSSNDNKPTVDIAIFTTDDVIALANDNHGKVISLDGIKDESGNAADNAKVVLEDKMPPMVVRSYFNGDFVVEFNEMILKPTDADNLTIKISNNVGGNTLTMTLDTLNEVVAGETQWTLSADGKTLTVLSALVPNDLRQNFDVGLYTESAYAGLEGYSATGNQHAIMNIDGARDVNDYSWEDWRQEDIDAGSCNTEVDLPEPNFAPVDLIGQFLANQDDRTNFRDTDGDTSITQTLVWVFTHKVETEASPIDDNDYPALFPDCDRTLHGDQAGELDKINTWFDYNDANISDAVDESTLTVYLASDCKTMTMEFSNTTVASGDKISNPDNVDNPPTHHVFTSEIDPLQHTTVSQSADGVN